MSKRDAMLLDEDGLAVVLSGLEIGVDEPKKRKRNPSRVGHDDDQVEIAERRYKRILLSLGKPSYVLGLGSNKLRHENRIRLISLLQRLVRQHDWAAASGVLSVLLRATRKESCPTINRFKYSTLLKLLQHMEGDYHSATTADDIFDAWMTRMTHRKRTGSMHEDRFLVRLESILFHFMQGNVEKLENASGLIQEHEFKNHPMFDMIIGLIFCQLWYSGIPEDMQLKHFNQMRQAIRSDMETDNSLSVAPASDFVDYNAGYSEENNVVSCDETISSKCGSDTSVMKNKVILDGNRVDPHTEKIDTEDDVKPLSISYPGDFTARGFYENPVDEDFDDHAGDANSMPIILGSSHLWLRPLHCDNIEELDKVIRRKEYSNAVMYLSRAASSTPPVQAALLPLIQLLLVNNTKGTLDKLESFFGNSSNSLPRRLKSCIMECVDPYDGDSLWRCHEDTLKSDPRCNQSLERLVSLHKQGIYSSDSLLEMTAWHLDATPGENSWWRELALCFLSVSRREEDRLSVVCHGESRETQRSASGCYSRIPRKLVSGESWRLRCKWWRTRHFSKSILASDIATGDWERLAYKAACAAHMYGRESGYVVEVYRCIDKEGDTNELVMFLKEHMRHCIGINPHFKLTT